jgi:hypothetical protein
MTLRMPLAVVLCLAAVPSCGGETGSDAPAPANGAAPTDTAARVPVDTPQPAVASDTSPAARPPAAADTGWTTADLAAPPVGERLPLPVLTGVRTGTHPGFERLTVDFGDGGGLPGYRLEYVDRPLHECGSGRQVFPVGDAWLELHLEPAAAHTEAGEATLGARESAVDGPVLRRIYRTCDFEGVVVLVLALDAPNPFRAFTLSAPRRLVVDIQR